MTRVASLRRDRHGVAAPDFAISVATVLILATTIFDLGNLIAARHSLDFGVAKAARFAAVNSTLANTATVTAAFIAAVTPALGAAAVKCTVQVTFSNNSNAVGSTVLVTATYPWTPGSVADGLVRISLSAQQALPIQH